MLEDEAPAPTSCDTKKDEDDIRSLVPYVDFVCGICNIKEKCIFGELKGSDGFYPSPVFFMRDPFVPPPRVKARRPVLADFLVIGSTCSICDQAICISKTCSIYFGGHFCANCIIREKRRFPPDVLKMLSKAQESEQSGSK